ncbi:plasmid pRiA4b ORF-3 family protein [Streptomyces sp. NPDC020681]|uniref:plasmid pRiA4b ORF-3 family protein n=1 Tax=Streptomyces sp. NPDC020681 TaxID=3365083 RepID=UPI0037BA4092
MLNSACRRASLFSSVVAGRLTVSGPQRARPSCCWSRCSQSSGAGPCCFLVLPHTNCRSPRPRGGPYSVETDRRGGHQAREAHQPDSTGAHGPPVKIALRGSKPPIWRRLEIPSRSTLVRLHETIQASFGWEGYRMWGTSNPRAATASPTQICRYAAPRPSGSTRCPRRRRLPPLYLRFRRHWEHDIHTEDITSPEPGTAYPRCLTGRRACPSEDCGGVWGYDHLFETLSDSARRTSGMARPRLSPPNRPPAFDPAKSTPPWRTSPVC